MFVKVKLIHLLQIHKEEKSIFSPYLLISTRLPTAWSPVSILHYFKHEYHQHQFNHHRHRRRRHHDHDHDHHQEDDHRGPIEWQRRESGLAPGSNTWCPQLTLTTKQEKDLEIEKKKKNIDRKQYLMLTVNTLNCNKIMKKLNRNMW